MFAALRTPLRQYLRRRVSDSAAVDDLLQDVFLKAVRALRAGQKIEFFPAWLYATARTTVIDYYRVTQPETVALDALELMAPAEDEALLHQALALCLEPLVQQLPPLYRAALLASDFSGQTLKSLALAQGVSLSAIKSRASRGRKLLQAQLLACCEVAWGQGLVRDYQPKTGAVCAGAGGCADVVAQSTAVAEPVPNKAAAAQARPKCAAPRAGGDKD